MRATSRHHRVLTTLFALVLSVESVSAVAAAAVVARGTDGRSTLPVASVATSASTPAGVAAIASGVRYGPTGSGSGRLGATAPFVSMAHSQPTPDNYMHAFTSTDGVTWSNLGRVFSEGVRDPALLYWDGSYWVAFTNVSGPTGAATDLGLLSAPSLTGPWTRVADVSTASAGATSTWAPQFFVDRDGSVHVLVSLKVSGRRQLYELHPTSPDWTTWSTPVPIRGTGWAANVIDPNLTYWDGIYFMMWKDDDTRTICLSTSASPFTGYRAVKTGDWAGWKLDSESIEGPQVVDIGTGWRIYFTANIGWDASHIYYSDTTDRSMTAGWSPRAVLSSFDVSNHPLPISLPTD
jgi:hypothetical protein